MARGREAPSSIVDSAIPASIAELRAASGSELESLYGAERPLEPRPHGLWRGHYLQRLDNRGARAPLSRLAQRLLFRTPPWGIDFDRGRWFFLDRPRLAAGHFALQAGPSRWRETTALGFDYSLSQLPRPVTNMLYDEIKPLSDELILGLGGENRDRGLGDHFWFGLERFR